MGRANFVVICAIIFMLMPMNTSVKMESKAAEWSSFTTQYRYLINDGKHELAEKMLNKRLTDMEQYVESLPTHQRLKWNLLLEPLMNGQTESFQSDAIKFVTYVEAVSSDETSQYINKALFNFRNKLRFNSFQDDSIMSEWERIIPVLSLRYKQEEIHSLTSSVTSLAHNDSFEARQNVIMQLDKLLEEESSSLMQDAFLWTVVIIGGTIMLTLVYVALRKFQGERKKEKSQGKENS